MFKYRIGRAPALQCRRHASVRRPRLSRSISVRSYEDDFGFEAEALGDSSADVTVKDAQPDYVAMTQAEVLDLLSRHLRGEEDSSDRLMFRKHGVQAAALFPVDTAADFAVAPDDAPEFRDRRGRNIYSEEADGSLDAAAEDKFGIEDDDIPWRMYEEDEVGNFALEDDIAQVEDLIEWEEIEDSEDDSDYDPAQEATNRSLELLEAEDMGWIQADVERQTDDLVPMLDLHFVYHKDWARQVVMEKGFELHHSQNHRSVNTFATTQEFGRHLQAAEIEDGKQHGHLKALDITEDTEHIDDEYAPGERAVMPAWARGMFELEETFDEFNARTREFLTARQKKWERWGKAMARTELRREWGDGMLEGDQHLEEPASPAKLDLPKAEAPVRFSGVGDDLDDFLVLADEGEEAGREQRERMRPSLVTGEPGEEPPFAAAEGDDAIIAEPIKLEAGRVNAKNWTSAHSADEPITP